MGVAPHKHDVISMHNIAIYQMNTKYISLEKYHRVVSIIMPPLRPLKKEGHIALHMSVGMSVGMSVSLNLVQLKTQERFVPEASNLVGR